MPANTVVESEGNQVNLTATKNNQQAGPRKTRGREMATSAPTSESLSDSLPSVDGSEHTQAHRQRDRNQRGVGGRKNSVAFPRRGMISSTMTRLLVSATPRSPCRAPTSQFQ